jgi:hypothetical protein
MEKNKFPTEVFPQVVRKVFAEYSQKLGLIEEYMYGAFMASVSTVIGNRYEIEIACGWTEKPMLWVCVVGASGTKKTPSIRVAINPIKRMDEDLYSEYLRLLEEYNNTPIDERKEMRKPFMQQLIAEDVTIEALGRILRYNEEGLLFFRDELIGLFNDTSRYSRNSSEQMWMSIFSNSSFKVNRVKEDSSFLVKNPFISVLGGIQPKILSQLFTDERKTNGMIHRFLYVYSDLDFSDVFQSGVNQELIEQYEAFMRSIREEIQIKYLDNTVESIKLNFSEEAKEIYRSWLKNFVYGIANEASAVQKEYVSKLEGTCARIALIIEVINCVATGRHIEEVQEKSIIAGISLVEYFYNNFNKVVELTQNGGEKATIRAERHDEVKDIFISKALEGVQKSDIVKYLLSNGFSNSEIHQSLKIAKSTINHFKNN